MDRIIVSHAGRPPARSAALSSECAYTVEQVLGDWLPDLELRSA